MSSDHFISSEASPLNLVFFFGFNIDRDGFLTGASYCASDYFACVLSSAKAHLLGKVSGLLVSLTSDAPTDVHDSLVY